MRGSPGWVILGTHIALAGQPPSSLRAGASPPLSAQTTPTVA
jgi:hypothetical protein